MLERNRELEKKKDIQMIIEKETNVRKKERKKGRKNKKERKKERKKEVN